MTPAKRKILSASSSERESIIQKYFADYIKAYPQSTKDGPIASFLLFMFLIPIALGINKAVLALGRPRR